MERHFFSKEAPMRYKDRDSSGSNLVEKFQVALETINYDLPRFGADGDFGGETWDAVVEFAKDHGFTVKKTQDLPVELVELVFKLAKTYVDVSLPNCFIDTRHRHSAQKRGGLRKWKDVTGITLHQTAMCILHEGDHRDSEIDKAALTASKIGVHHVVLRTGHSVWSNGYEYRMPQAQRVFNRHDVGIEIDGYFAGVEGDLKTFWKPRSTPDRKPMKGSEAQIQAALDTIDFIVAEVKRHGGEIKYIHAHRQTSASRTSDPGELLWKAVALPSMKKHGLTDGGDGFFIPEGKKAAVHPDFYSNTSGRPIPTQWDPERSHDYFERVRVPAPPDRG